MGIEVSQFNVKGYPVPKYTLQPFPACRHKAPGLSVTIFKAVPPGVHETVTNCKWSVSCEFLPYKDNQLFVTVQAKAVYGYDMQLPKNAVIWTFADKLKYSQIPQVSRYGIHYPSLHRNGCHMCCVRSNGLLYCNIENGEWFRKKLLGVRSCSLSPNGVYVATLVINLHQEYELRVFLKDIHQLFNYEYALCKNLCPNLKEDIRFSHKVRCIFSPDSNYLAGSISKSFLFVAKRNGLTLHAGIIPGMFDPEVTRLSALQAFDFDPREFHKNLAFGSTENTVYICDIDKQKIQMAIDVDIIDGGIDCLKYAPYGSVLAVGTSVSRVMLYCADTGKMLYALDCTSVSPDTSMASGDARNKCPKVCSLAFTEAGTHLAAGLSNCSVQVWQTHPHLSLQHMCRLVILQLVPAHLVHTLPLPSKVVAYLLRIPYQHKLIANNNSH